MIFQTVLTRVRPVRSVLRFRALSICFLAMACLVPVDSSFAQRDGAPATRAESTDAGQADTEELGSTLTLEELQQGVGKKGTVAGRALEKSLLVVQPASESTPALKYRLWQPNHTLKTGSAQLHFFRAMLLWKDQAADQRQRIESWTSENEPQPSQAELKKAIDTLASVYDEIHLLATAEDNSWDHRLRDLRGPAMYAYLLPDVQESRSLARLLDQKIRLQILEKDVDGAVESLRDGFRLAAFVGQGETLVQQLVGMAIEGIMLHNVEKVMQMPGAPNMYWPLATLPRPLVRIRESIEFELSSIHRVMPLLVEAETEVRSEAYWNEQWAKMLADFDILAGDTNSRTALAVVGVAAPGLAKARLVESGMDGLAVAALPDMQAVLIDASRSVREMSDELMKAQYLPGTLGESISQRAKKRFDDWTRENQMKSGAAVIMSLLFPAVEQARSAGVRQEYVINRLMTIEALRMHAQTHDGLLPKRLELLQPWPALPNPFSGEPFDYRLEQDGDAQVVTISAELPAHLEFLKEIKIRLQPSAL